MSKIINNNGGITYMNIIKNQLTFTESLQFVNGVIDSCFTQDEEGNDIDYSPASLQPLIQSTFVEMFSDYTFVDDFDANFAEYMAIDIDDLIQDKKVNATQFYGMTRAINDGIEFRKQKMLQKNIRVASILDEEIIKFANVLTEVVQNLPKNLDFSSIQPALEKISKMANPDEKKVIEALVKNASKKNKLLGFLPKKNKKSGE